MKTGLCDFLIQKTIITEDGLTLIKNCKQDLYIALRLLNIGHDLIAKLLLEFYKKKAITCNLGKPNLHIIKQQITPEEIRNAVKCGCIALTAIDDRKIILADRLDALLQKSIETMEIYFCTSKEFISMIESLFAENIIAHANNSRPNNDVRQEIIKMRKSAIYFAILCTLIFIYAKIFISICFALAVARFVLFLYSQEQQKTDTYYSNQKPHSLPSYSIEVPMYKEEKIVPQLIEAIKNIDYPEPLLDVHLLVEMEDKNTIEAIEKEDLPDNFYITKVPNIGFKTKPKALNYGFCFIRGEYLTIYDAEDIPHPHQLRAAVKIFALGGSKCAALQGILSCYNHNDSFVSKMFSLEYGMWFGYIFKAACALGMFIPLGGTTNHCRVEIMEQSGLWLPYNVTEDLELAINLYKSGYYIDFLPYETQEEAVRNWQDWLRQRTRWNKGYISLTMLSWAPIHLLKNRWYILPGFYILCVLTITLPISMIAACKIIYQTVKTQNLANLNTSIAVTIISLLYLYTAYHCNRKIHKEGIAKSVLRSMQYMLYCVMHLIGLARACWQLFWQPTLWEKTPHTRPKSNQ